LAQLPGAFSSVLATAFMEETMHSSIGMPSHHASLAAAIFSAPILLVCPVGAHEASEHPEGYVKNGTGEIVAYNDSRVRNSPDGVYHWCSVVGANDSKTICLFVPPKGY
jgi:hypothetical protein